MKPIQHVPLAVLLLAGCSASGTQPVPASLPGPAPTLAESVPLEPLEEPEAEAEPERESHEPTFRAHALSVFLGSSDELGDRDGFTFGFDYVHRFAPTWGLGVFAESVTGLSRSLALGVQGTYHATEQFILIAGPGMEKAEHGWGGMVRVGAAYEFELSEQWLLSPTLSYDFTERENLLVYGLNLSYLW